MISNALFIQSLHLWCILKAHLNVNIKAANFVSSADQVKPGENDPKEAVPPLTRFSSVIEKIERLYMVSV